MPKHYERPAPVVGREALCQKCGETFNPNTSDDLEHVVRADGEFCEGQGVLVGSWS